MREQLTETFRSGLAAAEAEARALNQDFVGTEHLILGILASGDSEACRALQQAHATPEALRLRLMRQMPKGKDDPLVTGRLPLSPKAQRVVNQAIALAQARQAASVSTRFILSAVLDDPQSVVAQAIVETGGDPDQLRRSLAELVVEDEK